MSSLTLDIRSVPFTRPSLRRAPATSRRAGRDIREVTGVDDPAKALVLRAREGDAEAFGRLYDRYLDLVYRYVYYRVGSHSLAEDLCSETFLRAWRRMADFNWQGKDFGAWLVTIARNLVADHFKSGRYRLEVCTADLLEPERPQEGPERAVLDSITHRAVLAAVRRLGEEQRQCVVLRFLHGLSVAETAVVMGKKTGAVKALQYRAVRSLTRMLPEDLQG
ncbi:sigma-70 family RNA polymerase sigma factor [Actinomadura rupiterrae]|uniref:sigma-70 family RNA polymerase sigma factor n=1 Tax=Actinomadura rupiterrae TaxID=559627 RepID=UPI0020A25C86|nr:sigma-70 family RNA polymerase sigma factor [Actinomadura rupiterrae]MCP2343488.1 RNA polymerase sigma-70 factor (ECF subfamily) [Actinomadura rupiterrae]